MDCQEAFQESLRCTRGGAGCRRSSEGQYAGGGSEESLSPADAAEDINFGKFIKRNKLFVAVSIGVVGLFFSNSVFNNFMLQIVQNVGGDGGDMGRILSLMAMLEIPALFLFDVIHSRISLQKRS